MKLYLLLAAVALATLCRASPYLSPVDESSRGVYYEPSSEEGASVQVPEDNITEDMEDSEERELMEDISEEALEAFETFEEAMESELFGSSSEESNSAVRSREASQEETAPRQPLKRMRTQRTKCSLEGAWHNQHGSEMILNITEEGHIAGEYRTAVESKLGAAGNGPDLIRGAGARSGASTFGFSVVWRGGASTTTWAGQCLICQGQEVLETTWLLVGEVGGCEDSWMSTRVGKDTFYRIPKGRDPRRHRGHIVPRD